MSQNSILEMCFASPIEFHEADFLDTSYFPGMMFSWHWASNIVFGSIDSELHMPPVPSN